MMALVAAAAAADDVALVRLFYWLIKSAAKTNWMIDLMRMIFWCLCVHVSWWLPLMTSKLLMSSWHSWPCKQNISIEFGTYLRRTSRQGARSMLAYSFCFLVCWFCFLCYLIILSSSFFLFLNFFIPNTLVSTRRTTLSKLILFIAQWRRVQSNLQHLLYSSIEKCQHHWLAMANFFVQVQEELV